MQGITLRPSASIPVPVEEEAVESLREEGPQPALRRREILEGVESQELREEVVQRILRIVMRQTARADEAIERVMILRAEVIQRAGAYRRIRVLEPPDQRPLRGGEFAVAFGRCRLVGWMAGSVREICRHRALDLAEIGGAECPDGVEQPCLCRLAQAGNDRVAGLPATRAHLDAQGPDFPPLEWRAAPPPRCSAAR